jgi:hypothetical protein
LVAQEVAGVFLVWTAGIFAVWFMSGIVLNADVDEADIQECVEERFFPRDQCEAALQALEDEEPTPISGGVAVLVWAVGSVLLWVILRPRGPQTQA